MWRLADNRRKDNGVEENALTTGSVRKSLIRFALPYLLACFMQTFYGMADLFVVGLYNSSRTTTAVAVGSQVMHMLTVMIVGLAMGATVRIGRQVGAGEGREAGKTVGAAAVFFAVLRRFSRWYFCSVWMA